MHTSTVLLGGSPPLAAWRAPSRMNPVRGRIGRIKLQRVGRICLKSPPRTTVIPPKGLSRLFSLVNLNTSRKLLSSASKQFLCAIGASSHSISDVFVSRSAAMPLDATATTIFPSDRSLAMIAFQRLQLG
ncbi:uncharacterized protein LOC110431989 [Sorghum bicolor]|uniref:uncharacterized protein LOC110431989 n=1 Tax=Sorghum bicolor TaxID=4558 RepID=UPI000B426016|nr:uncharacterized protein LOC110431989 [Sorghum bicolor]|eukprot:XP_021307559.1 uncharacterized protein LOC110431989 [Sorghum bicolor]